MRRWQPIHQLKKGDKGVKHFHMREDTLTPNIAGQQGLKELQLEKDERVSLGVGHRLGPADNLSKDVVAVGEHHVQN